MANQYEKLIEAGIDVFKGVGEKKGNISDYSTLPLISRFAHRLSNPPPNISTAQFEVVEQPQTNQREDTTIGKGVTVKGARRLQDPTATIITDKEAVAEVKSGSNIHRMQTPSGLIVEAQPVTPPQSSAPLLFGKEGYQPAQPGVQQEIPPGGIKPVENVSPAEQAKVEQAYLDKYFGGQDQSGQIISGIDNNTLAAVLGRIAQALDPEGAGKVGQLGEQMAQQNQYDAYLKSIQAGETPAASNLLTTEQKAQALTSQLETRRMDALEGLYEAQGEQYRATAAGTAPYDIAFENRLKEIDIKDKNSNHWMDTGQGHIFNFQTGDVKKLYNYKTGGGGDPAIQERQWYKQAYTQTMKDPRMQQYIKSTLLDKNGEVIFQFTDPIKAAQVRETIFREQMEKFVSAGKVSRNLLEATTTPDNTVTSPDGKRWRVLPSGDYEEIK